MYKVYHIFVNNPENFYVFGIFFGKKFGWY